MAVLPSPKSHSCDTIVEPVDDDLSINLTRRLVPPMEVGGLGTVSNAAVTVESQVPLPTVTVNDASSEPQAFETLNRTRYDPSLEYS